MKGKRTAKRILSMIMAIALMFSLLPVMPATTVSAASNTAPAVTQFATASELLTNFNTNGGTTKKVYFGQSSRQWWIVGKDSAGGVLCCFPPARLAGK